MDAHTNFALSTVATVPSPATTGTSLVVATGDGALFPSAPFNVTVWPAGVQPTAANAEIMRVTAKATDTFTVTRAQEGTSARSFTVNCQIAATITKRTLTDAEYGAHGVINVKDPQYGAVGDGVTDDTVAIQAAITAAATGGRVFIPPGKYRLTDELTVYPGQTIDGAGSADFVNGAPPNSSTVPTYLFQETSNKAIFLLEAACSSVAITNLSLAPALVPTATPPGVGKTGIKILGEYPDFIWQLVFDRLTFHNLDTGISCVDPASGGGDPDRSVAPVSVSRCLFYYPTTGVYLDTNNADDWVIDRCSFFVPSGGQGVYLYRFGFIRITNSFSGGASVSSNRFVRIYGDGTLSVDRVLIDHCQAETLTQFVYLEAGGGYGALEFSISIQYCIAEMGAELYFGNACNVTTIENRFAADMRVAHADVRLSMYNDQWQSADIYFIAGTPRTVFTTLINGPNPSSAYSAYQFLNGRATITAPVPPTTLDWLAGDQYINSTPGLLEPLGWVCVTAGTPGTWVPFGFPRSVSANNGDAAAVLTVASDPVQRWDTTLTADRAVTLPSTGAIEGMRIRIVRSAAGAFNLNVGTGPLKAVPAASWCEVEYDGSAWFLTAYGAL